MSKDWGQLGKELGEQAVMRIAQHEWHHLPPFQDKAAALAAVLDLINELDLDPEYKAHNKWVIHQLVKVTDWLVLQP